MTDTIQERLVSWAQNEEMIDQYYTQHGKDCIAAADEIDHLKRELAEKDKRIEELTRGVSPYCSGWHFSTDQIDAAWELWSKYKDMGARAALAELGIGPCEKCGGTKRVQTRCIGRVEDHDEYDGAHNCACPNNGWVMEKEAGHEG